MNTNIQQSQSSWNWFELLGQSNNSTSYSRPWISSLLWFRMVSLPQIILISMNNNRSANYRILPKQRNSLINETDINLARLISCYVSKISDVSLLSEGATMWGIVGIVVRTCSGASLGKISEFVDMNTVCTIRFETTGKACDFCWSCQIFLAEWDDPSNKWLVRVKDADSVAMGIGGGSLWVEGQRSKRKTSK